LLSCGAQSSEIRSTILVMLTADDKQEGQHPLTGQRAPPISGGT